jgi:hypothetical protein
MRQTPLLVFEATGGWWWPLEDETNPLLAFEAMEEGWWLLVDETKPLLVFEMTEGGVVTGGGQDEPPPCI